MSCFVRRIEILHEVGNFQFHEKIEYRGNFEFCGGIRNEINISQTDLGMEGKGIRL